MVRNFIIVYSLPPCPICTVFSMANIVNNTTLLDEITHYLKGLKKPENKDDWNNLVNEVLVQSEKTLHVKLRSRRDTIDRLIAEFFEEGGSPSSHGSSFIH